MEFKHSSSLGKELWLKPPAVRFGHLRSQPGGTATNPRSMVLEGLFCGVTLALTRRDTLIEMRADLVAVCHTPA